MELGRSLNFSPSISGPRWFNFERRNWVAAIFVSALLGYSAGNGHTTQSAIISVSEQLGQQKKVTVTALKAAGCEHHRAAVATDIAKQAITSANAVGAEAPSQDAIPQDNCPKVAPKK